jgi:phosphopantothenoylcysteine decarboxylase/phosphopantothenate--cysteine ligase
MSHVLLGASASVAIYKACDLASRLTQAGHEVRVALTNHAAKLVSPQLFAAVTGQPAATSEWGTDARTAMDHIELARWADVVAIAPCTADLAGRLAHGLGDDLVTTAVLAVDPKVPRLLAPAMNPTMLANPAVQRNLGLLREDGWHVVDPEEGHVACGEAGSGRLADPVRIADRIGELLRG